MQSPSRRPLFIMTGLLCVLLAAPQIAYASDSPTVHVGLYGAPHYAYQNDDGTYSGADVEYAYRIAQKVDLNIEITLFDNENALLESLDSGTTDMLFDFGKTEDREQKYLFSESPVGATALSVYAQTDDNRFTYGDIDQLKDKVFGCSAGNNIANIFTEWCEDHGFSPQIREYESADAVDGALDAGEVDAAIIGQSGHEGYATILTFSPQSYFIIFSKDAMGLKDKVDSAMSQILANDPLYEQELLEKYGISTLGVSGFSADEQTYISSHPNIEVAVVKDDYPYFWRGTDGSVQGIIPDYYARIAEFSGLTFAYEEYGSNAAAMDAVRSGQADLLAMYSDGVITAANEGLLLTDAYQNVDSVLLTRTGTDMSSIKTVAVKQRSVNNVKQGITTMLNADIIPSTNAETGFQALSSGQVDAMVCGLPTATWLLNQTNTSAYSSTILTTLKFDLCGATVSGNTVLTSIMDKSISATNYAFAGIIDENASRTSSWQTLIARIPPTQIAVIGAVFVAIIILLVLALITLIRRQKERALISAAQAENEKKQLQIEAIERSAEERGRFFSDVSHDMRTPLTAILGFSDLIEREDDPEVIKASNRKIKSSGELLLQLINDTLTLSKIGSNKLTLKMAPVDSLHLFDSVITPIQVAAKAKRITFTVDRTRTHSRIVLADSLNLQKIMLNLLSNAVKYTPEGGHVELVFLNDPEDSDEPDSVFIVKDDGIGMTEDFQQHMFEPFAQERRAGYGGSGTGLGLSIVNQLVELMGGTIDVQSKSGEGTTFTVRLHFQEIEKEDAPSAEDGGQTSPDLSALRGLRVLMCEDNVMNREIANALLGEKGIDVENAADGSIGLKLFSTSAVGEYDAILMDVRMPNMGGLDATRAIRSLNRPDAKTVPIIAMTADAFADDIQRCLDAGMNGHVAKPIDPTALFQELVGALRGAGSGSD